MVAMADREAPKLTRTPSTTKLYKTASRLSIESKIKISHHHETEVRHEDKSKVLANSKGTQNNSELSETQRDKDNNKNGNNNKIKDKDAKKGRKGKRKDKGKADKKEENEETDKKKSVVSQAESVFTTREGFRNYVFDKVNAALSIVYTDGITHVDVDKVTPLLKSLDISTNEEWFVDLIRNSIIDSFGEIDPLVLDTLVMKTLQENLVNNVDECLEAAFNLIDFDEDGFITQKDIRMLMLRLGETLGDYAFDDMILAVDGDKDGKISLRDFRCFLLGRDVPSQNESQIRLGQVNNTTKEKSDVQGCSNESATKQVTNSKTLVNENKFRNLRSEVTSIKFKSQIKTLELSSKEKTEASINSDYQPGLPSIENKVEDTLLRDTPQTNTNFAESIISPRKQESLRLKKLFFGGFIGKNTNLTHEASSTIQKEETKCSEANTSFLLSEENEKGGEIISGIIQPLTATFPDLYEECGINNDDVMFDKSLKHTVEKDNIEYDEQECVWDDGPIPLELEHKSLNLLPPDLSVVDVSFLAAKPTQCYSLRRQSVTSGSDVPVSVVNAESVGHLPESAEVSHHAATVHNSSPVNVQHSRPNSCQNKSDSFENDGFGNTLIINVRSRRSSSAASIVLPNNVDKKTLEKMNEAALNSNSAYKEGTDSDEGIELIDEEVMQRNLHIPLSPKASSTSLRIYLPRGDVLRNNDPSEDDRSGVYKPRPRLTIDLQNLSVDDEEDESVKQTSDDEANQKQAMNMCENVDAKRYAKTFRPKVINKVTHANSTLRSLDFNDSFCDEDLSDDTFHQNNHLNQREVTNLTAQNPIFNTHAKKSVNGRGKSSTIKSNYPVLQNKDATDEQPQGNNQQYIPITLNFSRVPANYHHVTTSLVQGMDNPSRQMKYDLNNARKYAEVERKSSQTVKILNSQSSTVSQNMSSFFIPSKRAVKEQITQVNYSQPIREGQAVYRANIDDWNSESKFEKLKHPQSTASTLQNRESFKQITSTLHQNNLFTTREHAIFSDSPDNSYEILKKTKHRKLRRSITSIELREPINEQQTHVMNIESALPKKRSFSAVASRNTRSTPSTKPKYKSISVVDLSQTAQLETFCNKSNSFPQRHFTVSNIVPLSRIVNGYQAKITGRHDHVYNSVPRQFDKSGVPYFLHSSSRLTNLLPDAYKLRGKITRRKGIRKKILQLNKLDNMDPLSVSKEDEISTLVSDFKDDDLIPRDVIFSKIRQFKDDF